jgi:hypothetical protein
MSSETIMNEKQGLKRRSFFARILAGVVGGAAFGGVAGNILHATESAVQDEDKVRVSINPLAVVRTNKGSNTHGE